MTASESAPFPRRLASCLEDGAKRGLKAAAWLLAFIVPVSLAVVFLHWTGALTHAAQWIAPAFKLVGLPGEAALAFLTGALLNIYSCIAALGPMMLDDRQVTILALMALISHNLPVEVAVQHKAGSRGGRMLVLRLLASAAAAIALNLLLPADTNPPHTRGVAETATTGLADTLRAWAVGTAWLGGKICVLVMGLMILQRILTDFGIIRPLSRLLSPVLGVLGLPRKTAFLWIVANTLGLAYGAAVILDEVESGAVTKEEVELLNRSIAVCHSLLEDTLLFFAIGAWAFWITAPRLILAAAAVWSYRAWRWSKCRRNATEARRAPRS